jgi:hypothetical protein
MDKGIKPKNIEFEHCKELIKLFFKEGVEPNFPKEIRMGKKMLKQYPIDFWRCYSPQKSYYSLAIFISKVMKGEIKRQYNLWLITKPPEKIKLEESPVVEIEGNEKKSLSLQEFVDSVL